MNATHTTPHQQRQLTGHPIERAHCDWSLCINLGRTGLFVLWIIHQASPALDNRGLYCMFNEWGSENQYVCQINSARPWCASVLFCTVWKVTLGNGPPLVPPISDLSADSTGWFSVSVVYREIVRPDGVVYTVVPQCSKTLVNVHRSLSQALVWNTTPYSHAEERRPGREGKWRSQAPTETISFSPPRSDGIFTLKLLV